MCFLYLAPYAWPILLCPLRVPKASALERSLATFRSDRCANSLFEAKFEWQDCLGLALELEAHWPILIESFKYSR